MKRVFWLVADSFGIGAQPDAAQYGDEGADTLRSVCRSAKLHIPCMQSLGLFCIGGQCGSPVGVYGRLTEKSAGKDTVTGHWEMCGIVCAQPFPVYPNGFPPQVTEPFCAAIGKDILCNKPYSGTRVLQDYGARHLATGCPIVYTSADSVFQIAAHEAVTDVEELYRYCRIAREILCAQHAVGRVIARPFTGAFPFVRTPQRRDFALEPPKETVLDALRNAGMDVLAVGKIGDIFAGRGITEHFPTHSNEEGMRVIASLLKRDFHGLCFANLVDFDMLYGHRRDVDGYAGALTALDCFLAQLLPQLREEDLLVVTGDHGCDPAFRGTDHTREYVPVLAYNKNLAPRNIGTRKTFADLGASVASALGVSWHGAGTAFLTEGD